MNVASVSLAIALLVAPMTALAAPRATPAAADASKAFITRHTGTFGGKRVAYTATVGETVLRDAAGTPTLRLVSTAYIRDGGDRARRPVLFVFNGGPSSSSSALHLLGLGPKRLDLPQDVTLPIPAAPALLDNPDSVLDAADIVFVDPAETGFSRVLPGGDRAVFYSADGDARSISDFVQTWVRENGREASPKYVLGESYGTIRAALMAGQLAAAMPLDGVFIFGQAVNIVETTQRERNALGYASNLPALAAIAAYHGRVDLNGRTMSAFIDEAYAWAMGPYMTALIKGADLSEAERRTVADQLQAFTGIRADYYLAHRLGISKVAFRTALLKDQGRTLGVYDARYTAPAPGPGQRPTDAFGAIPDRLPAALATYMATDLGVTWPMTDYRTYAPDTGSWSWSPTGGMGGPFSDFDYQAELSKAFAAKPTFRLVVGTGIYDTTTTVGPARQLVAQGDFPKDRVALRQYEGGHMAYTNFAAARAFSEDVRAWLGGGLPR